jgi:hypothetical protein
MISFRMRASVSLRQSPVAAFFVDLFVDFLGVVLGIAGFRPSLRQT